MIESQKQRLLREESILLSLSKLDYLSRSQIQRLHGLSGDRNARRVMQALSPFVSTFRGETGENIYYLNRVGRERTGAAVARSRIAQVGHYLMRNDYFIKHRPEEWRNEVKLTVKDVVTVIPDAYFRLNQRRQCLEVDHLQHMNKNREKIEKYKTLKQTGAVQEKLKYFPRLVWVTLTETRKRQLAEWCEGLDVVIYLWDDIK
jgi:hypothetical protein